MQPVFMVIGLGSFAAKAAGGASIGTPSQLTLILPGLLVLAIVGIAVGTWLDQRVSKAAASRLAITLALVGGVLTVIKGVTALVA